MAMPVGSTRMVNVVGEIPGKRSGDLVRVPISREFREWLLALWRRTGGDSDAISDASDTVARLDQDSFARTLMMMGG